MSTLVFVDSNILKFAATELPRYEPRQEQVQWGPVTVDVTTHALASVNPNERIANTGLRAEADLLPQVAAISGGGAVEFVQSVEALYETWGLPNLDSETGRFYGANIRLLKNVPFRYSRTMGGFGIDGKEEQIRFISQIRHPRFAELQRACGAFQGEGQPPNRNQLLDAFHLWSAEEAGCSYFLTLDLKLERILASGKVKPKARIVRPSQLLQALQQESGP